MMNSMITSYKFFRVPKQCLTHRFLATLSSRELFEPRTRTLQPSITFRGSSPPASIKFLIPNKVLIHLGLFQSVSMSSSSKEGDKSENLTCDIKKEESVKSENLTCDVKKEEFVMSENLTCDVKKDKVDTSILSTKEKLKLAVRDYGATVVVFHIGISLISLGGFYVAASSGLNVGDMVQSIGFDSPVTAATVGSAGTFVVAYAIHKVFAPVRITITLAAAPFIVRYLRSKGILKVKAKAPK